MRPHYVFPMEKKLAIGVNAFKYVIYDFSCDMAKVLFR